jgi:hypothetical protein
MITQTPQGDGPFELEMEMMVLNNPVALIDLITRMRMRLDQATRR